MNKLAIPALVLSTGLAFAASPPDHVNYQGVLRDAAGSPLSGSYDMVFRFWSAPSGDTADEILVDRHLAGGAGGVVVTGGLFNVALGSGTVSDGAGPGSHTSLGSVFRSYQTVYLEVQIANDPPMSPRVRIVSAPYALNADRLDGLDAADFMAASADSWVNTTGDNMTGNLTVSTPQSLGIFGQSYGANGTGIIGSGASAGGYFYDNLAGSGSAFLGMDHTGIEAYGNARGGYFKDTDGTGTAIAGTGNTGIDASGSAVAGVFTNSGASGRAYLGNGDDGIEAFGNFRAGYFQDSDSSGYAFIGFGDYGLQANGNTAGGHFAQTGGGTGSATLATGDAGIWAYGTRVGGEFHDGSTNAVAFVANNTYKIDGTGSVAFVQNHPEDATKAIVYNCPEGDEVATYTRGTARLVKGEARVALGETFRWVTNPDLGLTAYVTPVGSWADLYVASKSTRELVVKSRDGSDAAFDYVVYGLRIGFEEVSIVQERTFDAKIPSMHAHHDLYRRDPGAHRHTALARFTAMAQAAGEAVDLSRSRALHDAVGESPSTGSGSIDGGGEAAVIADGSAQSGTTHGGLLSGAPAEAVPVPARGSTGGPRGASGPVDAEGNVYGRSFRPALSEVASYMPVSGPVGIGDVVVADPAEPGRARTAERAADPGVIGIVAGEPGVALGGGMARITEADPGLARQLQELQQAGDAEGARGAWQELVLRFRQANAPVALSGIVLCRVDATAAPVEVGSLLVTSPLPGHAMRADDPRPGTVVAKALEPLASGRGLVKVLVMTR